MLSSWTNKAGSDSLQEDKEEILSTAEKISINVTVVAKCLAVLSFTSSYQAKLADTCLIGT